MTIAAWFKEKIRDDVANRLQSEGGLLDGTMKTGENQAGTIKFPVSGGRIKMYKLSGAIEEVRPQGLNFDTISLQAEDYTAEATIRNQDVARMGPSMQTEIAAGMAKAVRVKRDTMKLDALYAFSTATSTLTDTPSTVTRIGDGSARIDILNAGNAASQIRGAGGKEEAYWAIPYMWFDQLDWYKEFASKDYQGDKDLPLARSAMVQARTWRGIHILALPDEHFGYGTAAYTEGQTQWAAGYLDTFMWTKSAVGAEMFWNKESMDMNEWVGKAGKPILCDTALSGAAVGLLPEAVKTIRMLAINDTIRP